MEEVQYRNITFSIWDVGGQTKIRPLWKYYFQNTQVSPLDYCSIHATVVVTWVLL